MMPEKNILSVIRGDRISSVEIYLPTIRKTLFDSYYLSVITEENEWKTLLSSRAHRGGSGLEGHNPSEMSYYYNVW